MEGNQSQRDNEVSLEDRVLPLTLSEDIDVGQRLSQGQRNASQSSGPSARAFATRNRNEGGVGGSGMVVEGGLGSTPIRSGYGRQRYSSRARMEYLGGREFHHGRRHGGSVPQQVVMEGNVEQQQSSTMEETSARQEEHPRTRSTAQRNRRRVFLQGRPLQRNDGGNGSDDEESSEEEPIQRQKQTVISGVAKPFVVFSIEREYKAGYIWGYDTMFNVSIDSIQKVENAETNHRVLMEWRVNDMYKRLKGSEAEGVSAVTLRPIAYRYDSVNDEGETVLEEVPFSREGAAREFEIAFLKHCQADPSLSNEELRTRWLENNIMWEPVDGQHIIGACKRAKEEHTEGNMSDEEFHAHFERRKAKFVVYDNPQYYIEAFVRTNAREFDRTFFCTYYENLIKLHDIWKACGRPSTAARAEDVRRAKALTMAASALHWSQDLPQHMSLGRHCRRR